MCTRCSMCSSSFQARVGWRPLSPTMAYHHANKSSASRCASLAWPHVSSGWFKGIKAQCVCVCFCWGGGAVRVPVYRRLCQVFHQVALKQPVTHCTLLLPLLSCCWSMLGDFLCMHWSVHRALMFYIYSQAVHKTRASNISPQVSFKGGRRTAHICSALIKDWWSRRDNNIFVDLLNWCLPFCMLN